MVLPAPKLDDRSFQDLVDDAKRFVQERCPEWTDHNVSDPGVTLIEAFAWMTDLLLYRLNRVPDKLYIRFLDLLGVSLFPPTAAKVDVDFRLAQPQTNVISIPVGTVVATARTVTDESVSFTTSQKLDIIPAKAVFVGSGSAADEGGEIADVTNRMGIATVVPFSDPPVDGDALYIGFDVAVGGHTVHLTFACEEGRGHGIEPERPPLRWEAFSDEGWIGCDVGKDETLGFNVNGDVDLHIPPNHRTTRVGSRDLGMIRCRVVADPRIKPYRESPGIRDCRGATIGATVEAVNAEFVEEEHLGESTGVAGQEFQLQHGPVLPSDEPFVLTITPLDVSSENGSGEAHRGPDVWELRSDFADSGPDDKHFTLDRVDGVVRFGPIIREEDGTTRNLGAIPPKGARIDVPKYRYGGGNRGNVASRAISVLRTSIPLVASVANRYPARGGVDGETIAEAKVRGPVKLRTRNRAVTTEDFEILTREVAPDIRRVRCIADTEGDDPAGVRVMIVPSVDRPDGRISIPDLLPSDETCALIESYLDERRLVGTRVRVESAQYTGIRFRARISAQAHADPAEVAEAARTALYLHFNPVAGGSGGTGWPFGRSATIGEAYGVLQRVSGLDVVDELTMFSVDLGTGEADDVGATLELYPNELLLSHEHEVEITVAEASAS